MTMNNKWYWRARNASDWWWAAGDHGKVHLALSPSPLPLRAHFHRERETSGYEAEFPLDNITAIYILKSHESVKPTLRSRRLMAWGQLSMQLVPRPASSSGASFFAWQRRARNEWLVMNHKGPWEGYKQRAKPLSPSRLPLRAHFHQKRDVWVRGSTKTS